MSCKVLHGGKTSRVNNDRWAGVSEEQISATLLVLPHSDFALRNNSKCVAIEQIKIPIIIIINSDNIS